MKEVTVIIDLVLEEKSKRSPLRFAYKHMVNAGYTGRNQAEVRKHIEELARKGIPGPPTTPTLYPVIRQALVKDPVIEVYSRETCGEAEYVLLIENENRSKIGAPLDGTIIFSGTMAALTGGFAYGSRLSAELVDPKLNRRLALEYEVHPLDGFQ
jgi:hypothetical protein